MPEDQARRPEKTGGAGKFLQAACLTLLCLLAAALLLPRLLQLQPYVVLTGSMTPAFPVGGLIYVRGVSPAQVRVGDPITFRLSGTMVVTHRVVAKDEANRIFRTKGDANRAADDFSVPYANLIGRAVVCIPLLGYCAAYAGTLSGRIVIATAALCLALLAFLPGTLTRRLAAAQRRKKARLPAVPQKETKGP